jgi:hypothetical protein
MGNQLSLTGSSSTGTVGQIVHFDPPVQMVTMQTFGPSTGAGTVLLEASINSINWTTIGTSTHSSIATTFTSTSANLVSAVRARLATHTAGPGLSAIIVGR